MRNSFLAAALELRSGIPEGAAPEVQRPGHDPRPQHRRSSSTSSASASTPAKAGDVAFTINLITPDNGEQFVIELSNGTLTNLKGFLADDPDLTITINRADLEQAMIGRGSAAGAGRGRARPCSRATRAILQTLAACSSTSSSASRSCRAPGAAQLTPHQDAFAQEPLADTAGA